MALLRRQSRRKPTRPISPSEDDVMFGASSHEVSPPLQHAITRWLGWPLPCDVGPARFPHRAPYPPVLWPCFMPRGAHGVVSPVRSSPLSRSQKASTLCASRFESPCPRTGVLHPVRGRYPFGPVVAGLDSPVSPPFHLRGWPQPASPCEKQAPHRMTPSVCSALPIALELLPLRSLQPPRRLTSRLAVFA